MESRRSGAASMLKDGHRTDVSRDQIHECDPDTAPGSHRLEGPAVSAIAIAPQKVTRASGQETQQRWKEQGTARHRPDQGGNGHQRDQQKWQGGPQRSCAQCGCAWRRLRPRQQSDWRWKRFRHWHRGGPAADLGADSDGLDPSERTLGCPERMKAATRSRKSIRQPRQRRPEEAGERSSTAASKMTHPSIGSWARAECSVSSNSPPNVPRSSAAGRLPPSTIPAGPGGEK